MKTIKFCAPLLLSVGLLAATTGFSQAEEFTKDEIGSMVREYILTHPEVIYEAIDILQKEAEQQQGRQEGAALQQMGDLLFNNPVDPVGGNADGTVTLVEFFDYNCGYCKRSGTVLQTLIKQNPNLRVVYKEWPILSESSGEAAKIALAVNLAFPDQYEDFHRALLSMRSLRSANDVWTVVDKLALDRAPIEAMLTDPKVALHLQQTATLAQQLGITGTPAFVVGDVILKGAYPIEQIQQAIDQQS
ncbi:MAG: DsbA family protein [Reinekea forsetii]|jgi:protein-disulfide isomerase|nr:DsbA family protein [Reinekea forsetii]MDO7674322.1 DsbA family protein [Reinekea forsetii]